MTFYSLVLFVHITAMLVLFAALSLEALSLFHLRRASSPAEVRFWINPVPGLPLAATGSLIVVTLSGVYLTLLVSGFGADWPKVTIAALLFVAPVAAIGGRRMLAIRRTCATAKSISPELRDRVQDPVLKISLGIRIAVILGIVLLMSARPGLWGSVGIVAASFVLGLLSSVLVSRRRSAAAAPGATFGD
jgi:hypothetical protein